MKKRIAFLSLLVAPLLSSGAFADTLLPGTLGPIPGVPAIFPGTGSGGAFTATVFAAEYTPTGLNYATYAADFGAGHDVSGTFNTGDTIFAYVFDTFTAAPSAADPHHFSIVVGGTLDAVAVADPTRASASIISFTNQADFETTPVTPGNSSTVLLFASPDSLAALQMATLSDGASFSGLALSNSGTIGGPGTPLPTPAAAWGGLGLLGALAGARLVKRRQQT